MSDLKLNTKSDGRTLKHTSKNGNRLNEGCIYLELPQSHYRARGGRRGLNNRKERTRKERAELVFAIDLISHKSKDITYY